MSDPIWELAREYCIETEKYDRFVCTGRIVRGSVMPANTRELSMVNVNAGLVRRRLEPFARAMNVPWAEVKRACVSYENSQQYRDDMTTEGLMRYTPPHGN